MSRLSYRFVFSEDDASQVRALLELEEPLPYQTHSNGSGFYRLGRLSVEGSNSLDLVLYHTPATSAFIYTHEWSLDPNLMELVGLGADEIAGVDQMRLPGQLVMGAERAGIMGQAIDDVASGPVLHSSIPLYEQQNIAIFPIAREGLKYQVAEAIYQNYGYYCDEVLLDAHHVFDSSVPVYNRKVEMTLFKDKDLDSQQHENIRVAFIADSIASGLVMKETIARVDERFPKLEQVEVISPLTTVRGLCRIATTNMQNIRVRLHAFETLLNALPPDYYYSAHFNVPELHIDPELEKEYRRWWGQDGEGNFIADTACAGYGWSEAFYSPRKQIQMINDQLGMRHDLTIADVVRKHFAQQPPDQA